MISIISIIWATPRIEIIEIVEIGRVCGLATNTTEIIEIGRFLLFRLFGPPQESK